MVPSPTNKWKFSISNNILYANLHPMISHLARFNVADKENYKGRQREKYVKLNRPFIKNK